MLLDHTQLMKLSFEMGAIRPPSEGGSYSLLIRVTRNCPWNRCTFCYGRPYNHEKFELRSVDEVKGDIDTVHAMCEEIRKVSWEIGCAGDIHSMVGSTLIQRMPQLSHNQSFINVFNWLHSGAKTVFLQDADSLIVPSPKLVEIIKYLKESFVTISRVTSYARAKTLYKKKGEEVLQLSQAGLSRLHMGLETGDDELLWKVKKGATAEEHIQAGRKVMDAGIELSEYIMPGLGGKAMSRQHAVNTAIVLNAIDPDFTRSRPFTPIPGTPLFDSFENNELELLSPHECLEEMKIFVETLNITGRVCFDHFRNPAYRTEGGNLTHLLKQDYDGYKFPEEKESVLSLIERGLSISEDRFLQPEDYIRMGSL